MSEIYSEIENFKVMNVEEEAKKIKNAQKGDIIAKEELVNANMRFVAQRANHYANVYKNMAGEHTRCEFVNDLISIGGIELFDCIDRFDVSKNVRLITFAASGINGKMVEEMNRQYRLIHIPKKQIALLRKIDQAKKELFQENGAVPTASEIAERLGIKISEVNDLSKIAYVSNSLDEPADQNSEETYGDKISLQTEEQDLYYDDTVFRKDDKENIMRCFAELNKKEQDILSVCSIRHDFP